MSIQIIQHIEATPNVMGGKPRIAGHRIAVQDIAQWRYDVGWTDDQIAAEFSLTLGQVHAALSYYHDHRAEIDQAMREDRMLVEQMRALDEGRVG